MFISNENLARRGASAEDVFGEMSVRFVEFLFAEGFRVYSDGLIIDDLDKIEAMFDRLEAEYDADEPPEGGLIDTFDLGHRGSDDHDYYLFHARSLLNAVHACIARNMVE